MAIQVLTQTPCRVEKYPTYLFHILSFSTVVNVSVELFVELIAWQFCCCCLLYLSCQTSPSLSCNISSLPHSYLGRGGVWGWGVWSDATADITHRYIHSNHLLWEQNTKQMKNNVTVLAGRESRSKSIWLCQVHL